MCRFFKNASSGFVMIPMIIIMQVMMMLALSSLKIALFVRNTEYHDKLTKILSMESLRYLHEIESTPLKISECTIQQMATNDLKLKSKDWWQNNGCHITKDKVHFYYLIEILTTSLCAANDNNALPIEHFRITLFATIDHLKDQLFLQSIVIQQDFEREHCEVNYPSVHLGRQSWRKL